MNIRNFLFAVAGLCAATANAQKIEFFTPSIVHVVKEKGSAPEFKSEVVIAKPQQVKVTEKTSAGVTTYKSAELTVTVADGKVAFADSKGNVLLKEGDHQFTPINEGIDKGAFKVKQCFAIDKDEPIYGLGLLQNGKMSQRGEHRRMMQSNLEDFAHFFQSIKGYGIYWDNYSPTQIDDNATLE